MTQQTYGRYILGEQLGQGGMGVVFTAHDPHLDRDVAIKLLPHALLHDPNFRKRFTKEARLIARLRHAAIVPVYDFGQDHGQPYMIIELMTGGTLIERLAAGPLPLAEIDPIMRRICAALDKAHARKIIHRDIKPANILFDEDGKAYLSDFGIARLAEGTQTMTVIGTPRYMAPEQAYGTGLDARTDVYQMGVVLFEMLTGEAPFREDTPAALLYHHAHTPPPSPLTINETLPWGLEEVVKQALAKKKETRYATTGALADGYLRGCQVPALLPAAPPVSLPIEPIPGRKEASPQEDSRLESFAFKDENATPEGSIFPVAEEDDSFTELLPPQEPETLALLERKQEITSLGPIRPQTVLPRRRLPGWLWAVGGVTSVVLLLIIFFADTIFPTSTTTPTNVAAATQFEEAVVGETSTPTPTPTHLTAATPMSTSTSRPTATSTTSPSTTPTLTPTPVSTTPPSMQIWVTNGYALPTG